MQQTTLPVAIIGAPANYHHQVVQSVFGTEAAIQYVPTFSDVIDAVAAGTHCGVLAIRNSIMGSVAQNEQSLQSRANQITITTEFELPIKHELITAAKTPIRRLKKIIAHKAALQQCHAWLSAHTGITQEERTDNAAAIREVCHLADPCVAAIGSAYAAKYYGGSTHHISLTNQTKNSTTFAIIEPKNYVQKDEPMQQLHQLRTQLDKIDNTIIDQLAKRTQLCKAIGIFKKQQNLPVLDSARESLVLKRLEQLATKQHVPAELVRELYQVILQHSKNLQKLSTEAA